MKIWSSTSNFNRKSEEALQKITRINYIESWFSKVWALSEATENIAARRMTFHNVKLFRYGCTFASAKIHFIRKLYNSHL